MKQHMTRWAICGLGLALAAGLLAAVDTSKLPPAGKQAGVTFDQHIKPIFQKACADCHGPEKQKGKLRLDSREDALKGARGDKVILVGKSDQSVLVHAIARLDEDEAMPPEGKGDALTKEQVGLIRAWIDQGAK